MANFPLKRIFKAVLGQFFSIGKTALNALKSVTKFILGLLFIGASKINNKIDDKSIKLEKFFNNNDKTPIENKQKFYEEIKAYKLSEREKLKKFRRIDGAWKLISVGTGLFIGGLYFEKIFPIGAIGLGILSGAFVGWIGAIFNNFILKIYNEPNNLSLQKIEINPPKIIDENLPASRIELISKILQDAAIELQKLDKIALKLRHPQSIKYASQIIDSGKKLMDDVAKDGDKFNIAQRIFTYYCPQSVSVVNALVKIENDKNPDIKRIVATQSILQKLTLLFEKTELEIRADDYKALDIDLKLLDQSLRADS